MPQCELCKASSSTAISCSGAPSHWVCLACAQTCAAAAIAQGASVLSCFTKDDCKAGYLSTLRDKFTAPHMRSQLFLNSQGTARAVSKPSAMRKLEEDLTKALMRKCPGCRRPFVRIEGCPEMNCSSCGLRFCYLCTAAPKPRNHFASGECFGDAGAEEDMKARVQKIWEDGVARMTTAADRRAAQELEPAGKKGAA